MGIKFGSSLRFDISWEIGGRIIKYVELERFSFECWIVIGFESLRCVIVLQNSRHL